MDQSKLPFRLFDREGYLLLKMFGELNISNTSVFKNSIREFVDQMKNENEVKPIVFDFATLRYVDSSGIGALIDMKKLMEANRIKFGFVQIPNDIVRMLEMTKLISYFPMFPSEDECAEYVKSES